METKKTELILKIIQGYSPQHFEHGLNYNIEMVVDICNIVWDTANNEVDEICELKAEKDVLEQRLFEKDEIIDNFNSSLDDLEDIVISNDKQIQSQLSEIENSRYSIQTYEEYLLYVDENRNLYETKIDKLELIITNLQQENKELTYEIESNKTHLQDTYEEMQRTNQAEYERGLQEGYDDYLNDSNNEH